MPDKKSKPSVKAIRKPAVKTSDTPEDGAQCTVIGGTHKGKSGTIRDIHTSKTGHLTLTVVQKNGVRFKTLAKNVAVQGKD